MLLPIRLRRITTAITEKHQMMRQTLGVLLFKCLGAGTGFILFILIARLFGIHEAGVFFTAYAATPLIIILGKLGLDQIMMREASNKLSPAVVANCQRALHLVMAGSLGLMIILVAAGPVAAHHFREEKLVWLLPSLGMAAVILAIVFAIGDLIRGRGYILHSSFFMYACANSCTLLLLLSLAAWARISQVAIPLYALAGAFVVSALTTLVLSIRWLVKTMPEVLTPLSRKHEGLSYRDLFRQGLPLLITVVAITAINFTDTIVLASIRPSSEVAIYNAGLRIANMMTFIMIAAERTAGPPLSVAFLNDRKAELTRIYRHAVWITILLALPICGFIWLDAQQLMGLYGEEFRSGALVLVVLATGQLANAATGPAEQLLSITHMGRHMSRLVCMIALLNIPLNLLLAYQFGALGTALATAISIVGINISQAWLLYQKLGISNPILSLRLQQ